jgi:hypothetical protein
VECFRDHTYNISFTTPGNAVAAVFEKTLDELTREDAMTVGVSNTIMMQVHSRGMDAIMEAAGFREVELLGDVVTWPLMIHYTGSCVASQRQDFPEFKDRLALLSLDILREPPEGTSDHALAGVWWLISTAITGNADAAMRLISGGLLELAVATLHESSPVEWIAYRTPSEVLAGATFLLGWTLSTLELPVNKTELLIETGFIDIAISVLKAFELLGRKKVPDANVATVWCTCTMLSTLDLTAPEAQPIVRLLEGIPCVPVH